MTTRANAADKISKASAATPGNPETTDTQPTAQPERLPLADAKPLLFRLEHSLLFDNEDSYALQPKIGASCQVGDSMLGRRSKGTHTVWLPAAAWEGMATIIRQTPEWQRQNVALFLEIVASNLTTPIAGVLLELVEEVTNDPYKDVPETGRAGLDFVW
jgi:hypothetical protein